MCTVQFLNDIVKALEPGDWSVFSVLLSSSYKGFGVSSLDKDVEEIAQCVKYVKEYKAGSTSTSNRIVIMGHSTGSQDVLHYLHMPNPLPGQSGGQQAEGRLPVDGAILQSPVSDREALLSSLETGTMTDSSEVITELFYEAVEMAKENLAPESSHYILPISMTSRLGYPLPISSKRFLSLTSPESPEEPLEDDLFSSDLDDKQLRKTFGQVKRNGLLKKSLLVLMGGSDEYLPEWVDPEALVKRWKDVVLNSEGGEAAWDEHGGVVPGARHALKGSHQEKPIEDLVRRVQGYLANLEKE